jgi:predicted TIM-barrel fold metal-dependent hydrolase
MEIVDAHQHVGGMAGISGLDMAGSDLKSEAETRIAAMDMLGIDWAVIQPTQMYLRPEGITDTRRINDELATLHRLAPKRFRIALGTIDPLHADAGLVEAERCIRHLGLHGLSWHNRYQGCNIDSPLMLPALAKLRDLGGLAVIHTNATSKLEAVWRLVRAARLFPEVTFISLDAFHTYEEGEHALFLAETEKNILWDLGGPVAQWPIGWSMIEHWVKKHGGERLTFSADYIGQGTHGAVGAKQPRSVLLEKIQDSSLGQAEKALILGGNIRRASARFL